MHLAEGRVQTKPSEQPIQTSALAAQADALRGSENFTITKTTWTCPKSRERSKSDVPRKGGLTIYGVGLCVHEKRQPRERSSHATLLPRGEYVDHVLRAGVAYEKKRQQENTS